MTMEELDVLRGYGIALVIMSFVMIALAANFIPTTAKKFKEYTISCIGLIGGIGGLTVFFLFNFISGWDEYFTNKSSGDTVEYSGKHQAAAKVIETLGEMDVSTLGVVFGIIGLLLIVVSFINLKSACKPT